MLVYSDTWVHRKPSMIKGTETPKSRMKLFLQRLPIYITTDLNDDPSNADTACRCVENDTLSDLPADWKGQSDLPLTFYRASIFKGMTGKGATRIDTILANTPGSHA